MAKYSGLVMSIIEDLEAEGVPEDVRDKIAELLETWEKSRLQPGHIVIVHKPSDLDEDPGWDEEMDEFDGKEMEVIGYETETNLHVMLAGSDYVFNEKWLTKLSKRVC